MELELQYWSKYALFNDRGCIKEMKRVILEFMRGTAKLLRRFRVQVAGAVAIEAALVFPILLLAYVGVVEISYALTANRKVNMVASTVGDMIAQFNRTGPKALDGLFVAAGEIMKPFDATGLRINVYSIAGEADEANDWDYKNSAVTCTGETPTVPDGLLDEGGSVIITRVCYEFDSILHEFFPLGTVLANTYYTRPRRTDFITYDANL